MFRYVLASSERGLASLEEELTFLDGYLEIEWARFGERLCVTREIAPQALDISVPSLILQPLVENAVRRGQGSDGSINLNIRIRLLVQRQPQTATDHRRRGGPEPGARTGAAQNLALVNVSPLISTS